MSAHVLRERLLHCQELARKKFLAYKTCYWHRKLGTPAFGHFDLAENLPDSKSIFPLSNQAKIEVFNEIFGSNGFSIHWYLMNGNESLDVLEIESGKKNIFRFLIL